ncbi:MAG TPA: hypothetical protein VGH29_14070 [Candidatus Binataceae bacterium]
MAIAIIAASKLKTTTARLLEFIVSLIVKGAIPPSQYPGIESVAFSRALFVESKPPPINRRFIAVQKKQRPRGSRQESAKAQYWNLSASFPLAFASVPVLFVRLKPGSHRHD